VEHGGAGGAAWRGKLVAVIDEDALVLDAMGGMLRNWGCRVVTAATPKEALADLADEERPDLIISDYHLANGQSGIAAIAELHGALAATIPAFLMSGDTAPECLREALESGYHLLHKPVRPMTLRAMVPQHGRRRRSRVRRAHASSAVGATSLSASSHRSSNLA
jgi:CheY-like chemotaxis protein